MADSTPTEDIRGGTPQAVERVSEEARTLDEANKRSRAALAAMQERHEAGDEEGFRRATAEVAELTADVQRMTAHAERAGVIARTQASIEERMPLIAANRVGTAPELRDLDPSDPSARFVGFIAAHVRAARGELDYQPPNQVEIPLLRDSPRLHAQARAEVVRQGHKPHQADRMQRDAVLANATDNSLATNVAASWVFARQADNPLRRANVMIEPVTSGDNQKLLTASLGRSRRRVAVPTDPERTGTGGRDALFGTNNRDTAPVLKTPIAYAKHYVSNFDVDVNTIDSMGGQRFVDRAGEILSMTDDSGFGRECVIGAGAATQSYLTAPEGIGIGIPDTSGNAIVTTVVGGSVNAFTYQNILDMIALLKEPFRNENPTAFMSTSAWMHLLGSVTTTGHLNYQTFIGADGVANPRLPNGAPIIITDWLPWAKNVTTVVYMPTRRAHIWDFPTIRLFVGQDPDRFLQGSVFFGLDAAHDMIVEDYGATDFLVRTGITHNSG